MDVDNNPIITIITGAVVGFLGAIFIIGILKFREKLWRVKHFIRTILYKIYPSAFSQNAVHSETVIINSKVNNQSVVIIGEYAFLIQCIESLQNLQNVKYFISIMMQVFPKNAPDLD